MMDPIIKFVEGLSRIIPLEAYVVVGSILEELIAPIPSPLVMTSAGTLAEAAGKTYAYLIVLALLAAVGKTLGCWIFYVIGDKAEDLVLGKFGKFLGLSHKSVEHIGKHFNGSIKDDLIVFGLRALPLLPSTPLSVLAGVIKLNLRTFIVASFLGNIVRSLFFLYLGYTGISTLSHGIDSIQSLITVLIGLVIVALVGWAYLNRAKLNRHASTHDHE